MCDGAEHHPYLPTFCFQKVDGMTQILLPDIDFLANTFYVNDEFRDDIDYSENTCSAIFVGGTTGTIITRAGSAFSDSARIPLSAEQ
jgi:hypothetical protein